MVGCLIVADDTIVGEGLHEQCGGPHAEINALRAAGEAARGATLLVTLEPCCHQGRTPPCTDAIIAAGIRRVVAAMPDPFPKVAGEGFERLRQAGIEVTVGVLEEEARQLNAPYIHRIVTGRPWVIAKWAMTLDGKIASREGDSRWISCKASRSLVHQLRGRVDGILVGRRTAEIDDPLLTARPAGPRLATRIVVDSAASLSLESQLVKTANEVPVLVSAGPAAPDEQRARLEEAGCEVLVTPGTSHAERFEQLLDELGRREMTNLLVEGGGALLGTLRDANLIDEVHVFLAPLLTGGVSAPSPMGGVGLPSIADGIQLDSIVVEQIDHDIYLRGRVRRG